jgi:hypothetical protein
MILKFKVLGLGILAISTIAATGASASTSGHFTADPTDHHIIIKGTEAYPGEHNLYFQQTVNGQASGEPITCTHVGYHGTLSGVAATTTQSVSVRPVYKECSTNGWSPHNVTVDVPAACGTNVFEFRSRNPTPATVNLNCTITITHPECEMTVPAQPLNGIYYTTVIESNKHAVTLHVDATNITVHYHGGLCIFLGTTHTFRLTGFATAWGESTAGARVNITHT